jgi:hypothetical protein
LFSYLEEFSSRDVFALRSSETRALLLARLVPFQLLSYPHVAGALLPLPGPAQTAAVAVWFTDKSQFMGSISNVNGLLIVLVSVSPPDISKM